MNGRSSSGTSLDFASVEAPSSFLSSSLNADGPGFNDRLDYSVQDQKKKKEIDEINVATNVLDGTNFLVGSIATMLAIYWLLLANADDSDNKLEDSANDITLEGGTIGLASGVAISIVAAFIWYVAQTRLIEATNAKDENFDSIRKRVHTWFIISRPTVTLGNSVGPVFVESLFLLHLFPEAIGKPIKQLFSAIFGFIFAAVAIVFMNEDPDKDSIFKIGREGWARYTYPGLSLASIVGTGIGALIGLFIPFPGGILVSMAFFSALFSIIGFAAFALGVPLFNLAYSYFYPKPEATPETILETALEVTPEAIPETTPGSTPEAVNKPEVVNKLVNKEEIPYRTNYIRHGINWGTYLFGTIGFFVGLATPIPMGTLIFGAIFAAVGALIGAAVVGIWGPWLANKINPKQNSSSAFDYGGRAGAMFGNQYGVGSFLTGILMNLGIGKNVDVKNVACNAGGLIGLTAGSLYDIYCSFMKRNAIHLVNEEELNNPPDKNEPLPPFLPKYNKAYFFIKNEKNELIKVMYIENGKENEKYSVPIEQKDLDLIKSFLDKPTIDSTKPLQEQITNDELEKFWEVITKEEKPRLPWSQRIGTFAWAFSALGGIIGLVGGPAGVLIGSGVGGLVGCAVGGLYGEEIYLGISKTGKYIASQINQRILNLTKEGEQSKIEKSNPLSSTANITGELKRYHNNEENNEEQIPRDAHQAPPTQPSNKPRHYPNNSSFLRRPSSPGPGGLNERATDIPAP